MLERVALVEIASPATSVGEVNATLLWEATKAQDCMINCNS